MQKVFSTKLSKGLQKPLLRCFKSRAAFLKGTLAFKRGAKGLQKPLVRCFKSCATFLKGMVAFKGLSKGSQKHFQKVPQVATRESTQFRKGNILEKGQVSQKEKKQSIHTWISIRERCCLLFFPSCCVLHTEYCAVSRVS